MTSLSSQPSYSSSLSYFNSHLYMKQRQWLALGYVFTAGADIITTYFGLEKFGLVEQIPWTSYMIQQWGWEMVILRFILGSLFFLYVIRYQPNWMFKWTRIPMLVILITYFGLTALNNLILILMR